MNDYGRIDEEDVLNTGNPFDDILPENFEFDFVDNDDVWISGDCDPGRHQLDQANWFGNIEKFLLSDFDGLDQLDQSPLDEAAVADAFLSDVFVDSPPLPPPVDPVSGSSSNSEAAHDHCSNQFPSGQAGDPNQSNSSNQNDANSDRVGKKRERQLKNKDAAVRSRERKKLYVRDLELKSKYFEAECKRLGMMLQCCLAENQALKFSLQNGGAAFAASATRQESAVLLLESLLLGSLLWFLGITGLFILTLLLLLPILKEEAAAAPSPPPPPEDVAGGKSLVPRKEDPSNMFGGDSIYRFSMRSKKWRGSRTRMKADRRSWILVLFGLVGGLIR